MGKIFKELSEFWGLLTKDMFVIVFRQYNMEKWKIGLVPCKKVITTI